MRFFGPEFGARNRPRMSEFARRATVVVAIFFAFLVGLILLYTIRLIVVVLFLALILSAAIRPLVLSIERDLRMSRALAAATVYLGLGLMVAVVAVAILPAVVVEIVALVANLPIYLDLIATQLVLLEAFIARYEQVPGLTQQLARLPALVVGTAEQLAALPLGIFSLLAWLISIVFLAFYWLLERDAALHRISRLLPGPRRRRMQHLILRVEDRLGAYVRGELLVMGIIGLLTLAGLLVLGVRFALVLALLAALLEIIPIIGPILAAVPAVIIAFFQSPLLALAVIGLYTVIQQVEGNLIYPKVQERIVQVNAFFILLALLVGAELMGILGALIAVPALVALAVVLDELAPAEEPSSDKTRRAA